MTTDKELLEFAAKANGGLVYVDDMGWIHEDAQGNRGAWWHPLTDDGDALRLAVKLEIELRFTDFDVAARVTGTNTWHGSMRLEDKPRAVRYVITKAAAEIGRAL